MLALFHVTHMRNYWNTNDHPRTHQLWWWPRGVWWGLRRQETCWRGRRRWSDSSPQLSDSSQIWTNSFENQILLHVSLFFTLTLTSPGLSLWSPAGQSQVRFPAGERLQSSSTYIESVKVGNTETITKTPIECCKNIHGSNDIANDTADRENEPKKSFTQFPKRA